MEEIPLVVEAVVVLLVVVVVLNVVLLIIVGGTVVTLIGLLNVLGVVAGLGALVHSPYRTTEVFLWFPAITFLLSTTLLSWI